MGVQTLFLRGKKMLRSLRNVWECIFGDGYPIRSEEEKALLRTCEESYLRDPYRERLGPFRRIIKTYGLEIDRKTVLDLGPGHMGFFEMCKRIAQPGHLIGVERSPILIEIGRKRGYTMIYEVFTSGEFVKQIAPQSIDLLFCRGSLNPCAVSNFPQWWNSISTLLSPSSAIWICPWWGKSTPFSAAQKQRQIVIETLEAYGVRIVDAPRWLSGGYDVYFHELWLR